MLKTINFFKFDKNAVTPTRNLPTDAGLDLYALEDTFIVKGTTKNIKTGIAVEVPMGYYGQITDRSSLASKGLRTGAGVVDCGYAGPVNIVIHNLTANTERDPVLHLEGYRIKRGDRIAQMIILPIETPMPIEVKKLWYSERNNKGFGSSGV